MEKLTWNQILEVTEKTKLTQPHQFGNISNIDLCVIPYLPVELSDGTTVDAILDKCRGKILCSTPYYYKVETAFLKVNGAMPAGVFMKIMVEAGNLFKLGDTIPSAIYSFERPKVNPLDFQYNR